jgi:hypothetical protein
MTGSRTKNQIRKENKDPAKLVYENKDPGNVPAVSPGERRGHSPGSAIAEVDPGFGLNSFRSQSQIVDELFLSIR